MTEHRILVTGGAGFIGSHLCDRLVARGADVLCLDNFLTGKKANIAHLLDARNFELIRHDVVEPILLEVDQIYNLASPSAPAYYRNNPVKTVKTNVMGAINMLGMAKRVKARVLQASTSEIYGLPREHPQKESYRGYVNPIGSRSCYHEGKRVAETLMMDYHVQNKVDVCIARIFNTYGPRMGEDDGRVLSRFVAAALKGEPLPVRGDGSQVRSFCHVDDVVEGLIRLMDTPGFAGPVNIGHPAEISIFEVARKLVDLCESSSPVVCDNEPLGEDDPPKRAPDITLAREKLGWTPAIDLDPGLLTVVKDFRDRFAGV